MGNADFILSSSCLLCTITIIYIFKVAGRYFEMATAVIDIVFLVGISLVSVSTHSNFSAEHLPIQVVPSVDHTARCPTVQNLEMARENLRVDVENILSQFHSDAPWCGPGLWKRVAYLDMNDTLQQCPSNWTEYNHSFVRSCTRPNSTGSSCASELYSPGNYEYRRVCGRVIAYQNGSTDAFGRLNRELVNETIDSAYVDGLSLTYGAERAHIWTFAAGNSEVRPPDVSYARFACYCGDNSTNGMRPPPYVGNNFFCESAVNSDVTAMAMFYSEDPLWDGTNCPNTNCCDFNSPPWFTMQLPAPTTEDIEARICCDESSENEDVAVALLEIFVQ